MNMYKIKFKILAYGFPPVKNTYKVDGFELKTSIINSDNIKKAVNSTDFDTSIYIVSCSFNLENDDNSYYNYFENSDFIEINIPNKYLTDRISIKQYIMQKSNIINLVKSFEKKLRLELNVRIIFPIIKINIYDKNENFWDSMLTYRDFPSLVGLENFDFKLFEQNSHYHVDLNSFYQLEQSNVKFKRAIETFFESFEPSDISLRFLMLFTSLEALLLTSKYDITSKLADRVSKIMLYDNTEKTIFIYNRIKYLYKLRSKYIHGTKKEEITKELEQELRNYVREVLIIYWMYAITNNLNANQIVKNLKEDIFKADFQTRLVAKYLRVTDYKKAYHENCKLILQEIEKGNLKISKLEGNIIKSVTDIS